MIRVFPNVLLSTDIATRDPSDAQVCPVLACGAEWFVPMHPEQNCIGSAVGPPACDPARKDVDDEAV
jgi:hypothetical protein